MPPACGPSNAGGWSGSNLPVSPLSHHYFLTETIPEVAALDFEVPMTVDLEGFTYMRQDQKGILVGIYEVDHQHWMMDGAPWDYGIELLQEDIDRISDELALAFQRYPCLNEVGINATGSTAPSPSRPMATRWSARCLGPQLLAGLRCDGGLPAGRRCRQDAGRMDDPRRHRNRRLPDGHRPLRRFRVQRDYIKQTTGQFYSRRFVMTYPNEQLPAGRPLQDGAGP